MASIVEGALLVGDAVMLSVLELMNHSDICVAQSVYHYHVVTSSIILTIFDVSHLVSKAIIKKNHCMSSIPMQKLL
jgi:hypothetical protein